MMIEAEPKIVSFHNISIKQHYSSSIVLQNVLQAPINLIFTPSSSSFKTNPDEVHLAPFQSIAITISMYLENKPNLRMKREDFIMVRLRGEMTPLLKIPIQFSILSSSSPSPRSTSSSPISQKGRPPSRGRDESLAGERAHVMRELHQQNIVKDQRIKELEESIGRVTQKYPDMENIVQSVRREEREKYEERSQKILLLFRQKDEEIESLKQQVADQEKIILTYREIANTNKDLLSDKHFPSSHPSAITSERVIEENKRLNEELIQKNKEVRNLSGLKEVLAEKTEQLEAVVAELQTSKEKVKAMKGELKKKEETIAKLQADVDKVMKEKSALNEITQKLQDEVFVYRKNFLEAKHATNHQKIAMKAGVTEVDYEPQTEGGYATTTPQDFELLRNDPSYATARLYKDIASDYEEKYRQLSLRLQESMNAEKQLREELEAARRKIESEESERQLCQTELVDLKKQMNILADVASNDPPLTQTNPTSSQFMPNANTSDSHDAPPMTSGNVESAHCWWQYVWHDLQKQRQMLGETKDDDNTAIGIGMRWSGRSSGIGGGGSGGPGDYDYRLPTNPDDESAAPLIFHAQKLKENLRLQAIEISTLRQDLLGVKLRSSEETRSLENRVKVLEREKQKLVKLLTYQKQEKEIEVTSLKAKVQSLTALRSSSSSSTSPTGSGLALASAQISSLHSEVEAEKISSFHLRLELEEVRQLYETEKQRATALQSDVFQLESKLNAVSVVQTIREVPGISPYHVIQVFSTDFVTMRGEVERARGLVEEAQEEIRRLQRKMTTSTQQLKMMSAATTGSDDSKTSPPMMENVASANVSVTPAASGLPPLPPINTESPRKSRTTSVTTSSVRGRGSGSPIRSTSPQRLTQPRSTTKPAATTASTSASPSRYEQFIHRQPPPRSTSSPLAVPLPDLSEPIHLRVDNETTPKRLLQCLDLAILQNKCLSQEKMIEDLTSELERYQSITATSAVETIAMTSSPVRQQQLIEEQFLSLSDHVIVSRQEFSELEAVQKKLDLTSFQLEEVRRELEEVRQTNAQLEKRQLLSYYDTHWGQRSSVQGVVQGGGEGGVKLDETLPLLGRGSDYETGDDDTSSLLLKTSDMAPALATVKDLTWAKKFEALQVEHDRLRLTLQERTSQLKVLTESLDSLQASDADVTPETREIREIETNLFDLAYNPNHPTTTQTTSAPSSQMWVNRALSKRVIELSTDLLSTLSQHTTDQQTLKDRDHVIQALTREKHSLLIQQAKTDKRIVRQQQTIEQLVNEAKQTSAQFIEERAQLTSENQRCLSELSQREVQVQDLFLQLDELRQQLSHREKVDYMDVFQSLLSLNPDVFGHSVPSQQMIGGVGREEQRQSYSQTPPSQSEEEKGLKEMIAALLLHWKETEKKNSVSFFDSNATAASTASVNKSLLGGTTRVTKLLNKSEKDFLQKVSDFVLQLNDHLIATQEKLFHTQQALTQSQEHQNKAENSLSLVIQEMLRQKKRLSVYEKSLKLQHNQVVVKRTLTHDALLKQRIEAERRQKEELYRERNSLKKHLLVSSVELAVVREERARLLLANAQLEAKGSPYYQEKEQHLFNLNDKISTIEKRFLDYVEKEVPRLLSGLPVSEIDRFAFLHPSALDQPWLSAHTQAFASTPTTAPYNSMLGELGAGLGVGKMFDQTSQVSALTQALCLVKVNESKLELQLADVNERLQHYREKYSKVEAVLLKWKDAIEGDLTYAATPPTTASIPTSDNDPTTLVNKTSAQQQQLAELIARLEREVVLSNERESAYLRQIERNEEEKLKLEEDVIEYRNKLQVCQLQRQQLQELLDTSLENDEIVKSKAVQQLNKLRLDLENQHARDVRAVRQWYEEDKAHLLDEIQRLSQTISQHLLPLPDELEAAPRRRSLSDHSSSGDVIIHHSTSEDEHGGEEMRGKPLRTPSTTTSTERRHRHRYSSSPHTTPSNTSHTSFEAVKQAEQNQYFQHLLDERETSEQSKGALRPLPQHPSSSNSSTSSASSSSKGSGRGGVTALPVEEERGGDKENHPNLPPPPPPFPPSTVEEVSTAEESRKPPPPATTSITTSATSNMRDVSIDAMSHTNRAQGGVRGVEKMTVRPGSEVGTQTSGISSSSTSYSTTNTTKRKEDTSPPVSSNDRQSIQEEIIFNRIPFRQRLSQSHTTSNTTSNTNTERLVLPQIPLPHINLDTTSTTSSSSLHLLDPHNHSNITASDNNTIRAQIEAINQYNNNNTTSNTSDSNNNNNNDNNNDPSSSHNTSLLLQLQQENFQRAIERERRKSDEFLQEIRELEELLEIQQNYIREQLQGRERGSGRDRDRDRERHTDVFEEEVRKEDTSLWPSFSHLLEELLNSLHSLYSRCSEGSDDGNLVRGAIATANRLKLSSATLKPRHSSEFTPTAHTPFTSEAVGGSGSAGVQQSLDALTRRMKLIEQDLMSEEHLLGGRGNEEGGGGVPERYLYLLRDLRYKVNELTDVFHREFSTERDKWLKDKAYYVTQLHEVTSLQEAAKREHQQAVDSMRDYYDKALTQAQDSLQHNTASARREIERLEAVAQQLQQQLQQRQSQQQQQRPQPNPTANTSEGNVRLGEESVLRITKEQLEDYHRLQSQLSDTLNALEQLQVRHRLLTVQLNDEKRYMETNFRILKRSYETIIENLENKLLQANSSSDVTSTLNRDSEEVGDSRATSVDLQVQQLQHKYRVKCAELDAVLHLLSSVERGESHVTEPDTTSSEVMGFESDDRATMTSAPAHLSRQRIEEEMKEVRVRGLETEVLTLQEVLAEEKRRCQELQFQLQQTQKNPPPYNPTVMTSAPPEPPVGEEAALPNDMGKAFVSPTKHTLAVNAEKELIASAETTLRELGRDLVLPLPMTESLQNSENFKYVIKRHNSLRKAAKNDLTKLLHYLKHLPQTSSDVKALRETIQQQREEISRKHKLFTALKETKAQDGHALDLFKQEVKTLEDTVKRLQRQLASRDTMLKELKQRHDALQQQHQQLLVASQQQGLGDLSLMGMEPNAPNTSSGAAGGGGGGDNLYLMSAPEMRARIKELELERTRQRIRVQSLKDKIHEQEEALTSLGEEKKDLLSFKEKYEKAVLSIQRKEQQCQLYQEKVASLEKQIQQLQHDELQLQAESEKKIRQLQRQVDVALRHQKEYEEESKLLRERLIALNASQLADERERLTSSMQAPPQTSTSSTSNPGRRSGGPGGVTSGLTSAMNASTAVNRSVHFSDDVRAPEPTNTSNTSSFPLPSVIPPSLSSARDDLHDVIQAVGGTPPTSTTSNTTANNLLQRLTGLSSILFNDQPLPQPPPSTSSLNISSSTSSASPATFNMSAVPGNVSGGMLDTSSSSSSLFASRTHDTSSATASATASAIEKRLSALVSAALQSPPRK